MFYGVSKTVMCFLGGVFGLIVLATAIIYLCRSKFTPLAYDELSKRIKSWWIMAIIFSLDMILNRTISIVFLAFVSFLALKEYLSLIPTRRADRRVLFWVYLAIPIQYYFV